MLMDDSISPEFDYFECRTTEMVGNRYNLVNFGEQTESKFLSIHPVVLCSRKTAEGGLEFAAAEVAV